MLLNWTIPMGFADCEPSRTGMDGVRTISDIVDSGDGYRILVEMPGVAPDMLQIDVEDDTLTVKGTRPALAEDSKLLHDGRQAGRPYVGRFRLGKDIDRAAIRARLENGLLSLTLPRKEEEKPKRIEVQVG